MEKEVRTIIAFVLNFLLPGLGFCFSGISHRRRWLRLVGAAAIVLSVFLGLTDVMKMMMMIIMMTMMMAGLMSSNYSIGFTELAFAIITGLVFGLLSIDTEVDLSIKKSTDV